MDRSSRRRSISLQAGAVLPEVLQCTVARLPIGVVGTDASVWRPWIEAFVVRLRELSWIEGRTIAIEYRWSEGRPERYTEIAAEFVRLKVYVRPRPSTF